MKSAAIVDVRHLPPPPLRAPSVALRGPGLHLGVAIAVGEGAVQTAEEADATATAEDIADREAGASRRLTPLPTDLRAGVAEDTTVTAALPLHVAGGLLLNAVTEGRRVINLCYY